MIVVRGKPTAATENAAVVVNVTAGQYSWTEFQKLVLIQNITGANMHVRLGDAVAPAAASLDDWDFIIPTGAPPFRITVRIRYLSLWVADGGSPWIYQGGTVALATVMGWAENKASP